MKSFRDFMKEAVEAYYSGKGEKIGAGGDFFTAPELDSAFGRALAEFVSPFLGEFDSPAVVELGAGSGVMAYDMLSYFGRRGIELTYYIYELSPTLVDRQRETLKDFENVVWVKELPKVKGVILSNEFFDALPVHVVKEGKELFIDEEGNEHWREVERKEILLFLRAMGYEGLKQRIEVCLDCIDFLKRVSDSLLAGYHLLIDYGYTSQEIADFPQGTVVAYKRHKLDGDIYGEAGSKDITAQVNFSALMEYGRRFGLETVLFQKQRDFLMSVPGFVSELELLSTSEEPRDVERLSRLKTMLISMGDRFKVLLQKKS